MQMMQLPHTIQKLVVEKHLERSNIDSRHLYLLRKCIGVNKTKTLKKLKNSHTFLRLSSRRQITPRRVYPLPYWIMDQLPLHPHGIFLESVVVARKETTQVPKVRHAFLQDEHGNQIWINIRVMSNSMLVDYSNDHVNWKTFESKPPFSRFNLTM